MTIYIINILLIIVYAILIKNRKKFIILVSIQLFLILALRSSSLGVDLANYSAGFNYIKTLNFPEMISKLHFFKIADLIYPFDYESGYVVLNWVISHLGFNFHGFLVVCAFVNIFSFSYFIYKYSDIPWLSYVILCTFGIYTYFFGIIRQSLALSIFLWSLHFWINKKRLKSILLFIIAFLCHRAIIIALPIFLFANFKPINRKKFLILLIFSIPFLIFSRFIYVNVIYAIMSILGKGYVGHGLQLNNLIILLYFLSSIVLIFVNFDKIKNNKMCNISLYTLLISIFIEIMGLYNDNFARTMQIYNTFLLLSIPSLIKQYNNQKVIAIVKTLLVLLLIIFMVHSLKNSKIVPYEIETSNFLNEKLNVPLKKEEI